ncbi:alpha-hydroxy-acid oxidizing protein, partial [Lactobacillus jensenii]|uniref:alpha-hydroxy-acid oxidizing protein n=1 Tax=Lactobacillus jensenii TaxID=109790 RepID=UPI00286FBF8A
VQRSLTNMDNPSTEPQVIGIDLKTPIMICQSACHGIAHKDAEVATPQGAKAAGSLFSSSTYDNRSVEHIATATGDSPK